MFKTYRFVKLASSAMVIGVLAACSSLNLGTAGALQSIDVFEDDIVQMSFAIDAPLSVLPQDDGMIFKLDATTSELGERHVAAILVRGDDILTFSGLTPPSNNRAYHLFAFSEDDRVKIRDFQTWIRDMKAMPGTVGGKLSMNMELNFCRTKDVEIDQVRVSVFISLPGEAALNPLFSNVKLSELAGQTNERLPLCSQT